MTILFMCSTLKKCTHAIIELNEGEELGERIAVEMEAVVAWAADEGTSLDELVVTMRFK